MQRAVFRALGGGRVFLAFGRVFLAFGRVFLALGRVFLALGRVFLARVFLAFGRVSLALHWQPKRQQRVVVVLLEPLSDAQPKRWQQ